MFKPPSFAAEQLLSQNPTAWERDWRHGVTGDDDGRVGLAKRSAEQESKISGRPKQHVPLSGSGPSMFATTASAPIDPGNVGREAVMLY
jgi:hypothetical protein